MAEKQIRVTIKDEADRCGIPAYVDGELEPVKCERARGHAGPHRGRPEQATPSSTSDASE